jgi:hypothetical protein
LWRAGCGESRTSGSGERHGETDRLDKTDTAPHADSHWADGGPTSVDNLVLLCGHHHRLVHHSDWAVKINEGQPEFERLSA